MNDLPLVSVVTPAYNAAAFIAETLQSVQQQSYEHWEMVVVDDGSTDETAAIVGRYAAEDTRIRLISQPNGGVSKARNQGVNEAHGELIAFLDADDRWLPDKLTAHVEFMRSHPKASASFARAALIHFDGTATHRTTHNFTEQVAVQAVLYNNPTITTSNIVIYKSVFETLGGFDESMGHDEDIELLFRLTYHPGFELMGLNRILLQYRLCENGLSSNLAKMEAGWMTLMEKARTSAPDLIEQHYSAAHSAKLQYLARKSLRLNMPAAVGMSFINRAIAYRWKSLYKQPKMIAIALLIYLKLITFNQFKISI
ncbi:MAG: glucosyl transferase [Leptolyngbya foveolarum]|uniref:Glucosyl transferase n=1 Tax=Leptolyngbya foveolarum TaxID=47253 RepID=A0A2W4UR43_9CYAN|nr:MAG: glucosyl transferase [Leptolyngbya foveolarum]